MSFSISSFVELRKKKDALAKKAFELMKVVEDISNAKNRENPKRSLTRKEMMELARKTIEKHQ